MAKNHYVSQFIIKRFAPSVSTFDMQTNQIIEHRQAAKIFFDRDIYENDIEEKMAHDLEQPVASLLDKKIINCDVIRLTRKELNLLKKFLLLDSVRTYTPEHFQQAISNFHNNTQRYLMFAQLDMLGEKAKMLPVTKTLELSPYDLHMRAMKLYLECETVEEIVEHPLATQELYCWAEVVNGAYVSFWDSHDKHEFILSSSGMLSEYEPSHHVFEGLDLSKLSYMLEKMNDTKLSAMSRLFYAHGLSFNNLMYENFNVFNLSSTRCMVLVHPFFKLYNDDPNSINGEKIVLPKPDIWPSWIESREISKQPKVNYCFPGYFLPNDVFEYEAVKLSEWDTIYINQLILGQTFRLMGFNNIEKIIDSLACVNLLNSLCDRELLRELNGLDALERWVDNMLKDKYNFIFNHYKDKKFNCTIDPFEYIAHYTEMSLQDTRCNKYVLKYLLSDEEKIKTMPNFAFMGDPEQRVQLIKSDLQRLENQE